MYAQVEKPKENKSRGVANSVAQKKSYIRGFGFEDNRSNVDHVAQQMCKSGAWLPSREAGMADNRPEIAAQRKSQTLMNNSPQALRMAKFQAMVNNSAVVAAPRSNLGPPNFELPQQTQTLQLAHEGTPLLGIMPTKKAHRVSINDDVRLEREADVMETKPLQMRPGLLTTEPGSGTQIPAPRGAMSRVGGALQSSLGDRLRGYVLQRHAPVDAPIQRLYIEMVGDTGNASDYAAVTDYVGRLDFNGLYQLGTNILAQNDVNDVEFNLLNDILQRMQEAVDITDVNAQAINQSSIWTMASIFIGDQADDFQTQLHNGPDHYSDDFADPMAGKEAQVSSKDSEVGTLGEAYDIIAKLTQMNLRGATYIRIVVTGNIGPCDGCKERLKNFKANVEQLQYINVPVYVDSNYTTGNQTRDISRGRHQQYQTTYGFTDSGQVRSALGDLYWSRQI